MKKFLFVFVTLFFSMSLYAQEPLEFRGLPIDGNLTNFVSKMKSIGYTVIDEEDNLVFMKGKFTNRDVKLLVCSSVKTHTVWKVCVLFDEARSWSSLKSDYLEYKDLFTKKYGKASDSYEFFLSPYYEGDGFEFQALRNEKCHYITFWENNVGYIAVQMKASERLGIDYEDKINSKISSKEQDSSALDEI